MDERKSLKNQGDTNNIIIENRKKLSVSGVEDVESFDEENILIYTTMGVLSIKGQDLHINRLNVEAGDVAVEGIIDELSYSDSDGKKSSGFFSKLFK